MYRWQEGEKGVGIVYELSGIHTTVVPDHSAASVRCLHDLEIILFFIPFS